jgi:hypothetical protein
MLRPGKRLPGILRVGVIKTTPPLYRWGIVNPDEMIVVEAATQEDIAI